MSTNKQDLPVQNSDFSFSQMHSQVNLEDIDKKKLLNTMRNRKLSTYDSKAQGFWISDSIEEFQENSPGIYFYFFFLKFFGIVFLAIALFSTVHLVLNILGHYLERFGKTNFLIESTLGNIKGLVFSDQE